MKTKAGIWQGRFQPVHKGHFTMFERELLNFNEQFIAIVNPNPNVPPVEGFDNFSLTNNPFSYFQRMLIWKNIIDETNSKKCDGGKSANVIFFPCWHARKYCALENEFLPDRANRTWIIPTDRDCTEEQKAHDLERQGENIFPVECDETCNNITATYIRKHIDSEDIDDKMPHCIVDITKNLLKGITPGKFYIIPLIGDKIDIFSIQHAIDMANSQNNNIVFALTVKVDPNGPDRWTDENNLPWWFRQADHTDPKNDISFYQKSLMISRLMAKLKISNYFITPIFVKGDNLSVLGSYNNAFLPPLEQSFWLFKQGIPYLYGFNNYLRNINAKKIIIDNDLEIDSMLFDFFNEADNIDYLYNNNTNMYYEKLVSDIEFYKPTLIEWAASSTPGAQKHLTTISNLERKYKSGENICTDELTADRASLDSIIQWISKNKLAG